MVQVTEVWATLSREKVKLYHALDPHLNNIPILVFHGASTTGNATQNSSRIQFHVFSAAGFESYPRITVSPISPLYEVVEHLPRDRQGDEVCRGLAFGLLKYFKELPDFVKSTLSAQAAGQRGKRPGSSPVLFEEQHAADLANAMVNVENIQEIIDNLESALSPQHISNIDIDLVLPPGSITPYVNPEEGDSEEAIEDEDMVDPSLQQYGSYAPLIKMFGDVAFVPTAKLRRAPSRPTSLSRSKSFLRDQKLSLRREMGELVDTEERYVIKLHELVENMAEDYRQKAKAKAFGSFSPSEQDLERLFPKSLDKILEVNSAFLDDIRKVMDETEEDAMQDIEISMGSVSSRHGPTTGRPRDPTGARAFAHVLLEWFPKFSDCYQDYIRASQDFGQIITSFVGQQSSFSRRVQQTGEQVLRSAVIEPVQRLPRYSLFIDNIINFLPLAHPALQPMLKARDMVTAICSLDPPVADKSTIAKRLRNFVDMWPSSLQPSGRLISAVDFVELPAPYNLGASTSCRTGILLLFSDCVVILEKSRDCTLSGRGVLAEVEKPSPSVMMASVTAAAGGQRQAYELTFMGWHHLVEVKFTESHEGHVVWMGASKDARDATMARDRRLNTASMRAFMLQGPYEGKASKWTEEVTKARIEGRFPERERETGKWAMRSTNQKQSGLNLFAAVFEEGIDTLVEGRKEPAPLRIVVDHDRGTKGAPVGHYGVEIVANILVVNDARGVTYRIEMTGLNDRTFVDNVDSALFMPTFTRRVGDLIKHQFSTVNPATTSMLVAFHTKVLKTLTCQLEGERIRTFRAPSPVKLLSNFLSGGSVNGLSSSPKSRPMLSNIPSMPPVSRSESQREAPTEKDYFNQIRIHVDDTSPVNPFVRLEESFNGYVAALRSRKGNIIGATLRNRGAADELAVNDVYNRFIENPVDPRIEEAPVDVIFAAFEKYLRMAWKDQMGSVMTLQTLQLLQDKSAELFPGDFADYVKQLFGEIAPQNRRAFISLIKLLIDLLDGCGNDGDRGALTVAFAELLITEGDPQAYLNLMDRFVEDGDRLFGENMSTPSSQAVTPLSGSVSSLNKSHRSVNTGSVNSNASSLRRRFGLDTLLRQNSKNDSDRSSVWRTLSKQNRQTATVELKTSSLSKASVNRERANTSTERLPSPTRPTTRDRPTILGAFDQRPLSSQTLDGFVQPASPGLFRSATVKQTKKKKRRSSLSDLSTLMDKAQIQDDLVLNRSPPKLLQDDEPKLQDPPSPVRTVNSISPRTPSPTKIPVTRSPTIKLKSPSQFKEKENAPLSTRINDASEKLQRSLDDPIVFKEPWTPSRGHTKNKSISSIPTLRGNPNSPVRTHRTSISTKSSPQKLKLQSPSKLRERNQREAQALNDIEASLQNELSKIGEEMTSLIRSPSRRQSEMSRLTEKVKSFESKIPVLIRDLNAKNEAVQRDLEQSLQASELKVQGLEQLNKEAGAENELLYEKYNSELARLVKAVRGKTTEDRELLITKLLECSEEMARVKKENVKMKRELLMLGMMPSSERN